MKLVAGVDEVGRGPLAGPVVACALILPRGHSIVGLKDSKKLSKKKREALYPIIKRQALTIGIGISDVDTIDQINIREATFIAMKDAISKLDPKPEKALIDGEHIKDLLIPNKGIKGGDNKIDAIKAASIIAKVTRDNIMTEYSGIFYEYGFENNSGYGTKLHLEALKKYKATPIHRKSFKPVASQLPSLNWVVERDMIRWLGLKLAGLFLMKRGFRNVQIINNHPFSNRVDIICQKNNMQHYINVHAYQKDIDAKKSKDKKDISLNSFEVVSKSENFKFEKANLGQIFVGLQKGRPEITFKENIVLNSKMVNK